jgi:hypothetical protein
MIVVPVAVFMAAPSSSDLRPIIDGMGQGVNRNVRSREKISAALQDSLPRAATLCCSEHAGWAGERTGIAKVKEMQP